MELINIAEASVEQLSRAEAALQEELERLWTKHDDLELQLDHVKGLIDSLEDFNWNVQHKIDELEDDENVSIRNDD